MAGRAGGQVGFSLIVGDDSSFAGNIRTGQENIFSSFLYDRFYALSSFMIREKLFLPVQTTLNRDRD